MFLLFGEGVKNKKISEGQFTCPCCQKSATYVHYQARSYFSLFFIPLFPLNLEADYFECQQCQGSFDSRSTIRPDFAKHQELIPLLLGVLLREEGMNAHAKGHYFAMVKHYTQRELTDTDLHQLLTHLPVGGLFEMLKKQRIYLNPTSKVRIIQASYAFLSGLRALERNDRISLNLIGSALDIDTQCIKDLIRHWTN